MTPAQFNLASLLAPVDTETFFGDYWEQKSLLVARNDPEYYSGLFSVADLDALIYYSRPTLPPVAEAESEFGHCFIRLTTPELKRETKHKSPPVGMLCEMYGQGRTIIVNHLPYRWPPVAKMCRNLEMDLHHPVGANCYLTPQNSQCFIPHYDHHDFFIVQLEGYKDWQLWESPHPSSVNGIPLGQTQIEQLGPPATEFRMQTGDLLYVPRGVPHVASSRDSHSLHLTLGMFIYSWADLLRSALEVLTNQDVRFRKALPVGWLNGCPTTLEEQFRHMLRLLADNANLRDTVEQQATTFLGNDIFQLPDGHFARMEQWEGIGLDTVLQKRPGSLCRVIKRPDGSVDIQFPGWHVGGPGHIEAAARFIAAADHFTPRQLPEGLTDNAKLVLVKRLVREGLLTIVDTNAKGGATHSMN